MAAEPSVITCAHCRRPSDSYFQVTRIDASGTERGRVRVCSAICLIQWSYQYTIHSGVRLVQGAKGALDRLVQMLRGIR